MDWFKKHVDAIIVLTAVIGSVLWMNGRFNEIDKDMASMQKDMAVIKTVLVMRNIMPMEMAKTQE